MAALFAGRYPDINAVATEVTIDRIMVLQGKLNTIPFMARIRYIPAVPTGTPINEPARESNRG